MTDAVEMIKMQITYSISSAILFFNILLKDGDCLMQLTDKELEIMSVLWESSTSMTVADILEASENRSWSINSIFIMMTKLEKKGAVDYLYKPTTTKPARAYKPTLSPEEFIAGSIASVAVKPKLRLNIDVLIKAIRGKFGESEDRT